MLEYIKHCQNNLTNNNSNTLQFLYPDNKDIDEFRKFIQEYKGFDPMSDRLYHDIEAR